jgi:protein tyrosine phosphatase (PTP) superfamily phosphohydrolase (DUF442 family)
MMRLKRRTLVGGIALLGGSALWGVIHLEPVVAQTKPVISVIGLPAPEKQAGQWQSPERSSGPMRGIPIRNFGVVVPGCLYRSGQPKEKGYQWMRQQGFKGIVCLRKEYDNGTDKMKSYGLNYLYLPITNERTPTDDQAREFLAFVQNRENWPVLVHCEAGVGRASTMAALARYAMDGWSMSDALREARKYRPFGFRMFGQQRRWLNRWKDRFTAGQYHPSRTVTSSPVAVVAEPAKTEETVAAEE